MQECEINVLVIAIFSHTLLKNNIISDPKDKSNISDVNVYFFCITIILVHLPLITRSFFYIFIHIVIIITCSATSIFLTAFIIAVIISNNYNSKNRIYCRWMQTRFIFNCCWYEIKSFKASIINGRYALSCIHGWHRIITLTDTVLLNLQKYYVHTIT